MMKCEMGIALPASYMHNSNCFLHENKNTIWTHEENKLFENALALYDKDTSDRWQKVAEMIPGKTTADVMKHYKDLEDDVSRIEAGLIPIPGYSTSSFTLQWVNRDEVDGLKSSYAAGGKRLAARHDQERKKGVPWTEDEHRRFLMGLKKYGKGDWRNISRNFVITRTPTQVASHAQKYFIRQCSGGKDKRRSSIHDITTVNLTDERPPSPSLSSSLSMQNNLAGVPKAPDQLPSSTDSKQSGDAAMVFSQTAPHGQGNPFEQPLYGITSYGLKMQVPNYQRGDFLDSQVRPQNMVYQPHPRG